MPWACPELADLGVQWFIKRDDLTGNEIGGNKARKLEFLMAAALAEGCDSVVTIGGLQSNHCRATAAAARQAGLEPHLVLLVRDKDKDKEVGLGGNLLVERMLGAKLHLCPAKHYLRYGADLGAMDKLNHAAAEQLRRQGKRPYIVPVGGTTPVGTWGYLAAVEELRLQQEQSVQAADGAVPHFDHVLVTCGSGGTTAGLSLGMRLAGVTSADAPTRTRLHAVNVQHTPEVFYDLIDREAAELGVTAAMGLGGSRDWLAIHDGGGTGYGNTNESQLRTILHVASESGVVLDHTYTGKALHTFCEHARANPDAFRGQSILFWHTGGLPGLAAQEAGLLGVLEPPALLEPP